MRRVARFLVATLALIGLSATSAQALQTTAGMPAKIEGPLLISKYSFQGDQVRFVELYNDSDDVVDLAGWSVAAHQPGATEPDRLVELDGLMAPGSWLTVGDIALFEATSQPTFSYSYQQPALPVELRGIGLYSPAGRYLTELVEPSISKATIRLETSPPIYGFQRNQSTSTGNYTSSYRAVLPDASFQPYDDGLYERPASVVVQIVEVYPHPDDCSPLETFVSMPLCFDYVKLYNPTDDTIDLADYSLHSSNDVVVADLLLPAKSYNVLPIKLNNTGWVWIEDRYGVAAYADTLIDYPDSSTKPNQAWSWDGAAWRWTLYPTPYDSANQFTDGQPVNTCDGLRLSEIAANHQPQFIEIYNSGSQAVDLAGCQLMTNRSDSNRYIFADQQLDSGGRLAIEIDETDLILTKTTTGTVYLLSSDGVVEVDARAYENLSEGTSLALVDGVWVQTFVVTPGGANQHAEYPPCQADYWRNTETGRCNKVAVMAGLDACGVGRERNPTTGRCRALSSASQLTPCRPGQERNPETNRCRSIVQATSALTACRPGQERNPVTNRCRSIDSAASTLKPCAVGQERNPETNRCRKIPVAAAADTIGFPVEPISDVGQAFSAWWTLGGVLLLGAGYGAWEWRHEVSRLVRRATSWGRLK